MDERSERIDDENLPEKIMAGNAEEIVKEISNENPVFEDKKEIEKIQNQQIKWSLILMIGIILIVVLVPFIKTNFIDSFDYYGLKFQKTQLGDELIFYSAKFPVVASTGQVVGDYSVNFRNDPRELKNIPANISENKIKFALKKNEEGKLGYGPVYISLNPFMEVCPQSGIALITMSSFMKDSGLEVSSAVTDKAYGEKNNETVKWCYDTPLETVVVVTDGETNEINELAPNCYEIKFKECEILKVTERFTLILLEEYAKRFS
jgi:hypothetical protein